MPCDSNYMEPNCREKELSKILYLLDELNGKGRPNPQQFGTGYDRRVYCCWSRKKDDKLVADLCSRLQGIPSNVLAKDYSLEMQTWWRDHKSADKKRLRSELKAIKDEQAKQKALLKLTSHERSLLGL